MTTSYAIVDTNTGIVANVIDYTVTPGNPPPGFASNFIAILNEGAAPGWLWNGSAFINPNPPPPPTPAQQAAKAIAQAQNVALQCLAFGVAYPATWAAYANSAAAVVAGTSATLPTAPPMPALPTATGPGTVTVGPVP